MSNFTFSKNSKPNLGYTISNVSSRKSPQWSFRGLFLGFLGLILFVALSAAGTGLYLYYMQKDKLIGCIAVPLLKNQTFDVSDFMSQNSNLSFDDKLTIKASYEKFLQDYDSMPENKQTLIQQNIGKLVLKIIDEPKFMDQEKMPEELITLVQTIFPEQKFSEESKTSDYPEQEIWKKLIEEASKPKPQIVQTKPKPRPTRWRRSRRYRRR